MVTKINISIKEELLQKMDQAAREAHVTRSALIAQAVEHLMAEKEREKRKEKMQKAAETMDRFREKFGNWDATSEVLKWRELH